MALAVTFSVAFGFADVGSGVVVRIGVVVFWGDGGVVDDVTVVVVKIAAALANDELAPAI